MAEHREIGKPSLERQDKLYKVVITDETDEGKEVVNEVMSGLCVVGERDDRMCEIVLNENILGISSMLASGTKTKHAVRLATLIENMRKQDTAEMATEFEDMLSDLMTGVEGGIQ
jgi:hypothetical protein